MRQTEPLDSATETADLMLESREVESKLCRNDSPHWSVICPRIIFASLIIVSLIAVCTSQPKPRTFDGIASTSSPHLSNNTASGVPLTQVPLQTALTKALRSATAGFVAGAMQVLAFMWLRTAMNYQCKFGGSLMVVLRILYKEGGVVRLYQGLLPWAIVQAPLSRFGSVFANDVAISLCAFVLPSLSFGIATFIGACLGALWRIAITPIDTCKTIAQTDGASGRSMLWRKVHRGGIGVLWAGWEGNFMASLIGNYPWFMTLNLLESILPMPRDKLWLLIRHAVVGAVCSSVSDIASNAVRVLKTIKQTHTNERLGYMGAAREVIAQEGASGLLCRGLETRVYTNVLQGTFFTVIWRYLST